MNIGIIGSGIAGLHLGLFLQKRGIAATIYAEKTPEQQFGGRLRNIVVRSAPTRERERLLGVNHWDSPTINGTRISFCVNGERPLAFHGNLDRPISIVDMRIYCARLLEDFVMRGGPLVIDTLQAQDVERRSEEHDVMVIAVGRGKLITLFPRIPEYSPYDRPQRLIFGALCRGIACPEPRGFEVIIVPGHGEILALPIHSYEPGLTGLGFEIVPGGAFEVLRRLRYEDDPGHFNATLLRLLREFAPAVAMRIDPDVFGITRPLDHLYTAITPTVRRGYTRLANGKFAVALGDAHVITDPIIGQGANTASHAAWVLGEAIDEGGPMDEAFCRRVEQRIWSYTRPVTESSNARLQPPPPHVVALMVAAAQHQAIADAYANGFNQPDRFWQMLSSPERTATFLKQCGWRGMLAEAVVD